jgi:hypothetical protein
MEQIPYPIEKYTYYVERLLLLNDPTAEPTEFITTTAPSPSPNELQYVLDASVKTSIITSVITTYFVLIFSYFCVVLRAKLKRRYLSGSESSHSDSTCTKQEPFWFNDVYDDESQEYTVKFDVALDRERSIR